MTPSTTSQQNLSTDQPNNESNSIDNESHAQHSNVRFNRDEAAHLHTLFAAIHHNLAWCDTRDADDWELSETFPHFADWSHIDDDGDYNPRANIPVTPGDHLADHDDTINAMRDLCEAIAGELNNDADETQTPSTTDGSTADQQTTLTGYAD